MSYTEQEMINDWLKTNTVKVAKDSYGLVRKDECSVKAINYKTVGEY